jgi:hypothetical protein
MCPPLIYLYIFTELIELYFYIIKLKLVIRIYKIIKHGYLSNNESITQAYTLSAKQCTFLFQQQSSW